MKLFNNSDQNSGDEYGIQWRIDHMTTEFPYNYSRILIRIPLANLSGQLMTMEFFKKKLQQSKIVLRKIYYSLQSKNSRSLEVGEETKLQPAFGNSLCTRGYKPKSENPSLFFLTSQAPRN